jgi:hypothetical protein
MLYCMYVVCTYIHSCIYARITRSAGSLLEPISSMYVCMYVCLCMHACMHIFIHTSILLSHVVCTAYVCIYLCIHPSFMLLSTIIPLSHALWLSGKLKKAILAKGYKIPDAGLMESMGNRKFRFATLPSVSVFRGLAGALLPRKF